MKSNDTIRMKFRAALHHVGRGSARILVSQTNGGHRRPGHAFVAVWHDGFRFSPRPCTGWVRRSHVAEDVSRWAEQVRDCSAPANHDGKAT